MVTDWAIHRLLLVGSVRTGVKTLRAISAEASIPSETRILTVAYRAQVSGLGR